MTYLVHFIPETLIAYLALVFSSNSNPLDMSQGISGNALAIEDIYDFFFFISGKQHKTKIFALKIKINLT